MRKGPIVLLIGTAAVVGWLAPGLRVDSRPTDESATLQAVKAPDKAGLEKAGLEKAGLDRAAQAKREAWLSGSTVVNRSADGHFYLDANVDGRSTHFLVDTGASVVALTADDARAAGLEWQDSDVVPIGRGANGTVYGVPVHLERVALDSFEAHDVDAAIIPEGLDVSLLGQTFLAQLPGVTINGDRMVLGADE